MARSGKPLRPWSRETGWEYLLSGSYGRGSVCIIMGIFSALNLSQEEVQRLPIHNRGSYFAPNASHEEFKGEPRLTYINLELAPLLVLLPTSD